jgi:hypothetical protein
MDFGAGSFRGARPLTEEPLPPGTPEYRSPAAVRFQWHWRLPLLARYEAGPADDVYALGVTAYRLVTGAYPPPMELVDVLEEEAQDVRLPPLPHEALARVCPELEAVIRRMLSNEPSARGSAAEVAEALERAMETAGPEADQPIPASAAPAHPVRRARPPRSFDARAWAAAVIVSAALVLGAWWAVQPVEQPVDVAREVAGAGTKGGEPVGLGDGGVTAAVTPSKPALARVGVGLDMPKEPLPGQRRMPCKARYEVGIRDGCWVLLGNMKPPCVDSYDWQGVCYAPSYPPERPASSEEP